MNQHQLGTGLKKFGMATNFTGVVPADLHPQPITSAAAILVQRAIIARKQERTPAVTAVPVNSKVRKGKPAAPRAPEDSTYLLIGKSRASTVPMAITLPSWHPLLAPVAYLVNQVVIARAMAIAMLQQIANFAMKGITNLCTMQKFAIFVTVVVLVTGTAHLPQRAKVPVQQVIIVQLDRFHRNNTRVHF